MSKLKSPLFDTAVYIEYEQQITPNLFNKMKFSMVVLYELTATTIDRQLLQKFERIKVELNKRGDLVTPTMTDWWETAKMIRRLRFGEKSAAGGKTPKIPDASRMQNDALIARNAYLNDCYVVTTNFEDFVRFVPFMENLEIVAAEDFFA
jgi:predicted nucleic acid-binding protein